MIARESSIKCTSHYGYPVAAQNIQTIYGTSVTASLPFPPTSSRSNSHTPRREITITLLVVVIGALMYVVEGEADGFQHPREYLLGDCDADDRSEAEGHYSDAVSCKYCGTSL